MMFFFMFFSNGVLVCLRSVLTQMKSKDWNLAKGFVWKQDKLSFGSKIEEHK